MGYTHYWDSPGQEKTVEAKWNAFLNDCKEIGLRGLEKEVLGDWEGEGTPDFSNVEENGISFNGRGDYSHETFEMTSYARLGGGFSFCKTAMKPYDLYVTACLTVFHDYFGNVRSDGGADQWAEGVALANEILGGTEFQNPMEVE